MKIDIQTKIAELESRIVALEAKQSRSTWSPEADKEWTSMWKHFDKFFEKVFK